LKTKDEDGILTTNFYTRSMYERPINGKYILDTSIPPILLPLLIFLPFKNLHLQTTSGSVTAEVWITYDGGPRKKNEKEASLFAIGQQ